MDENKIDVVEGKWFPNKVIVGIISVLLLGAISSTWKVTAFYTSVQYEKQIQKMQYKQINSDMTEIRIGIRTAINNNNTLIQNNNTLISEVLKVLQVNKDIPLKKTQPVMLMGK